MKVVIFGLGYVGCTAAGCISSQGHTVVGVDVSKVKVDALNAGRSPVCEPGLNEFVAAARADGRIRAVTEIGDELDDADVAIVCVGTPSSVDGGYNLSYIVQVTRTIAEHIQAGRATPLAVVYRSTLRPGTIENMVRPIFRKALGPAADSLVNLVYNPEFLREATAIEDYFHPPKIVLGTFDGTIPQAIAALHEGIEAPVFHVGVREAEITKLVDNAWHAVKVAFANEVGRICQNQDISAKTTHDIFVSDTKLNISAYYTRPGGPFGGSCLPKDVRALQHISADVGAQTPLIDSLLRSNETHKHHQYVRATAGLLPGAKVLLVGLAFKIYTDDLRESPAVDLARKLLDSGYDVDVYDPQLRPESLIGQNLGYAYAVLPSIDGLLVDRATAEATDYAVVIATNRLVHELDLRGRRIVDVSAIA